MGVGSVYNLDKAMRQAPGLKESQNFPNHRKRQVLIKSSF